MPSRARKRQVITKKTLAEEMSTGLYWEMLEKVRKLTREGMTWTEAEKKVFGKFFKQHQK